MSYLKVMDASAPQYIVVIVHDQYEKTVYLFCTEESARACYDDNNKCGNEVYLTKIMEQNA